MTVLWTFAAVLLVIGHSGYSPGKYVTVFDTMGLRYLYYLYHNTYSHGKQRKSVFQLLFYSTFPEDKIITGFQWILLMFCRMGIWCLNKPACKDLNTSRPSITLPALKIGWHFQLVLPLLVNHHLCKLNGITLIKTSLKVALVPHSIWPLNGQKWITEL